MNLENFLRCGKVDLATWLMLDEQTQEKLTQTAIALQKEFIGMLAIAITNPQYAVSLLGEAVGEDFLTQNILDAATIKAAKNLAENKVVTTK